MPTKFLLSPSETKLAEAFGDEAMVSDIPESKGADILIYTVNGLFGGQRKAIPHDFLTSFTDGRLTRAIPLLKDNCTFARIIGEGRFKYYPDTSVDLGKIKGGSRIKTRFTKKHIKGMINDIQLVHGIMIDWTDDIEDTVAYLRSMRHFLNADKHVGLFTRPNVKGVWAVPSSKDVELWLLQSFPGVGPAIADSIIQHFGGVVPLKWTCTFDELCAVAKLSPKKAREVWNFLPTSTQIPASAVLVGAESFFTPQFNALRNKLKRC